ncbi:MAG TPA: hypothetical protein VKS21_08965 [Spirochaetota bacterium]|nr:hypothetical protein [Spirochaetota bacterium]
MIQVKKSLTLLVISLLLVTTVNCSRQTDKNLRSLAEKTISLLNSGNKKDLLHSMYPKNKYITNIFPHSPEGRTGGIDGAEYFDNFIHLVRLKRINSHIRKYKGKIKQLFSVGKPEKSFKYANGYIMHCKIPLQMEIKTKNGLKKITNNSILGLVIEKDSQYHLLKNDEIKN